MLLEGGGGEPKGSTYEKGGKRGQGEADEEQRDGSVLESTEAETRAEYRQTN